VISPAVCAQLSADIYGGKDFGKMWTIGGVVIGLKRVDGFDVLALRGSLTVEDWMRDFEVLPVWHSGLGFVHGGFLEDMDEVYATVSAVVGPNVVTTGHSLGGARARILAAMFAVAGKPVSMVCVFGSPKPGFENLARVIQKSGTVHLSYRNRRDVVPLVPMAPWWAHPEDWTVCDAAPSADNLEALRDHSSALYVQALNK
jgi:pimeloyl-ACP methyl ester carboxylesterase